MSTKLEAPVAAVGIDNINYSHAGEPNVASGSTHHGRPKRDVESNCEEFGFNDKTIRRGFIRRVYFILTIQLLVTVCFICCFVFIEKLKTFVKNNIVVFWVALALFIVIYIAILLSRTLSRRVPINYIMLTLFTLSLSFVTGALSSTYETKVVLSAMVICAVCCLAVTLFSLQTKIDLTPHYWVGFVLCLVLICFGLSFGVFYSHVMYSVYSGLGALLFMFILAIDTQFIVGGKRYQLSPEEYVAGAIFLYVDIVQIFLFLLGMQSN